MSLNTIADVRELLSPEQWTIARCATLISKGGTDDVNCVPVTVSILGGEVHTI